MLEPQRQAPVKSSYTWKRGQRQLPNLQVEPVPQVTPVATLEPQTHTPFASSYTWPREQTHLPCLHKVPVGQVTPVQDSLPRLESHVLEIAL